MANNALDRPTCDINVLDRAFYLDPYPGYAWIRENRPIYWDDGNGIWILSRYADVSYVSLHPDLFCSGKGIRPVGDLQLSLVGLDGERHTQQRRLINKGFSPRMIRDIEPRVRQVVTEVLDEVDTMESCDFLADIAVPVPLIVIAELMGLPVEDRKRFWEWSDAMMAGEGRTEPDDPALLGAAVAFGEYVDYLSGTIEERRATYRAGRAAEGPSDLISTLVAASEEGVLESSEELANDELIMFLVLLVVAGNETTRNAMTGGMWALNRFPEQWDRLCRDRSLLETAPDELIRYSSPVISFSRTATQDTELHDQLIRRDERVLMLYQSANRDESVFEAPDELRLDRSPNPHLAFGTGSHVCLGMNLARLEVRVLFDELTRRFPHMRVRPGFEPQYGDSLLVHALESLPVEVGAR